MIRRRVRFRALIATAVLLGVLPALSAGAADYASVTGPCRFSFPEDHGAHTEHRTEWWYYTGNLRTGGGDRYGFQLTFFRTRILPPGGAEAPAQPSAWRTPQIYLAHAAVSDLTGGRHRHAERTARGAVGLAGVRAEADGVVVFLHDWSARIADGTHRLGARAEDFSFELVLRAEKPVTAHGREGYSAKGSGPGRASCYYSFTRLAAEGRVDAGKGPVAVVGSAWMDHEYSTSPLEPGLVGWDWFSLQLSDGSDLMLYLLRDAEGGSHPASSGTWVGPAGDARHLEAADFQVTVTDRWESPHSGAVYPAGWRVRVPDLTVSLAVSPAMADQEMATPRSTGVVYWEGSVSAEGSRDGKPLQGVGYVELTGYAEPFDAPM